MRFLSVIHRMSPKVAGVAVKVAAVIYANFHKISQLPVHV